VRIAFFGTPEYAVPSLLALLGEGFEVAVVVTQPDRPHGRSHSELVPPPVKVTATDEGIPVLQPDGSTLFRPQQQTNAALTATLSQRLPLTGGDFFVSSSLARLSVAGQQTIETWSYPRHGSFRRVPNDTLSPWNRSRCLVPPLPGVTPPTMRVP